ncbi:MAG: DUF3800 domain-containing protein [Clostridia bacterium]|nr:DUF3800 domain-containing protein [Clostridia bacterium]
MSDRILSVFIDESGDFGAYDVHTPYYIVAMILHDQNTDIKDNIRLLDKHIIEAGFDIHAIHTGPLIRRESIYSNEMMENRKCLFNALFHFSRILDFKYVCPMIRKSECPDVITMTGKLSKAIKKELMFHQDYWNSFDKVIVYYDNGQIELTKILSSVFNVLYADVEFRKVQPVDYKLFQVADMVCTLELLSLKADSNSFSRSETEFFHSVRDFRKNYFKTLEKKHL